MRLDWFSRDKGSLKINNLVAFFFSFSGRTLASHFVLSNLENESMNTRIVKFLVSCPDFDSNFPE